MNYLPHTNSAVHNMAPSLSDWIGASDISTQTPYLGSSHAHGALQYHQQPVLDANSYP
jgi:hypothetical protein